MALSLTAALIAIPIIQIQSSGQLTADHRCEIIQKVAFKTAIITIMKMSAQHKPNRSGFYVVPAANVSVHLARNR